MSKRESESGQSQPSEIEKFQTIARLIGRRLEELYTKPRAAFTAAEERELETLEELNRTWVREHSGQ